jgi:predicted N-acetyltransferase YhbS
MRQLTLPYFVETRQVKDADAHWRIMNNTQTLGQYSLWWKNTPSLNGCKLGFIGHYEALDTNAREILTHACFELAKQGCNIAVAPIDGNTWQRYRLLTERSAYPTFFLEPDNPDNWRQHFIEQHFTPLANYSSSLNTDLTQVDTRLQLVKQRCEQVNIHIRALDLKNQQQELHHIYNVATQSFRNNFLYTPIDEAQFIAQYQSLLPYIQPELVLIAEHNQNPVGFLFAIPDWLQKQREEVINTVIIKTVAILPKRIYAGLGNLLVAQCQQIAHKLGYTQAIHALMHDANPSRNLSNHYATTIRRYTLFSKKLNTASSLLSC